MREGESLHITTRCRMLLLSRRKEGSRGWRESMAPLPFFSELCVWMKQLPELLKSTRLVYLVFILISSNNNTASLNNVKIGITSGWITLGIPSVDCFLTEGISACLQTSTLSLHVKFLLGKGWVQSGWISSTCSGLCFEPSWTTTACCSQWY